MDGLPSVFEEWLRKQEPIKIIIINKNNYIGGFEISKRTHERSRKRARETLGHIARPFLVLTQI